MTSRRFWTIALLGCLSAFALYRLLPKLRQQTPTTDLAGSRPASVSAVSRSLRPNYPYSVVPGGVYSPAELKAVAKKDALVRSHYADFEVQNAHLIANSDDRFQYVSFRMNGKIFWTHRKIHIPKGEILLTDGKSFCRTRCGNRLSDQPHLETTAMEPSEHALNLPPFRPELLNDGELSLAAPPDLGDLAPAEGLGAPARLAPVLPQGDEAAFSAPKSELAESGGTPLVPGGFFGGPGVPTTRTQAGTGVPAIGPTSPSGLTPLTVPPASGSNGSGPTGGGASGGGPTGSGPNTGSPSGSGTSGTGPTGGGPIGGGPTPPLPPGLKPPPVVPITAIPEPSTSALASLAFGFAIYLGWRKAKNSLSH